jgi:hypothetical protein
MLPWIKPIGRISQRAGTQVGFSRLGIYEY